MFDKIYEVGDVIVSGGCPKGDDWFAEIIASEMNIPIIIHHPDKSKMVLNGHNHRSEFRKVAFERNTLIAKDSDVLIACVSPDRTGGTENTIKKFIKMKGSKGFLYLV
jgi:hypothetical protein